MRPVPKSPLVLRRPAPGRSTTSGRGRTTARRRARLLPRWLLRLDDHAARWINGGSDSSAVDRAFARLSRAADRGVLWFSIAAALAMFGQRRAAIRGAVSLIAASMAGNLVGKQVFGGDRPLLKDVPVGRRLRKHPTTPSFPSGHSASAAAFAAGVAAESPAAGFLLAPLAAAVAYSRLHTGAHWLSDVAGGVVLGVGVAALGTATRQLVPERAIGGEGTPVDLPSSQKGAGVLILANRSAGRHVSRRDPLREVARRLPLATLHVLRKGEQPEDVVADALAGAGPPVVLGVAGGDGTVSAVAHIARRHGLPLLVIAAGTFNHFARAVGAVPVDGAVDALQAGRGLAVDVAEASVDDGRPITVLNAAGIGLYPHFLAERARFEGRWTRWGASVLAGVRLVRAAQPVTITLGGRRTTAWSLFVSVDRNDPRLVSTLQRRGLDDRVLDVRLLHAGGSRIRAVASLIFGRRTSALLRAVGLMPPRSRVESFSAPSLDVVVAASDARPRLSHDGELERLAPSEGAAAHTATLHVRVVPDGLTVYSHGPDPAAVTADAD